MRLCLFIIVFNFISFIAVAQERIDILPKLKKTYISIKPVGITFASLENYAFGFGLEHKFSSKWSVSSSLTFGVYNFCPNHSKTRNISLSAQYIAVSNKWIEISGGLAFNYIKDNYWYDGGISHSGSGELIHFGGIGIPVVFKYFISSWIFGQVMCQPIFSNHQFSELGHLSFGVRF